ncbi:Hypothetical protein NTJ_09421 [Nesidiocoris tenuis]|uniref:Uncharacterized protein n=1 Tax=Nesidiocoris tenuis TaxID=355587 RepID=A0ABN7AWN9_9HEMI|nr:Hypothetical protein NTJ_09421 [Nesidiocoris tenuis]
MSPRQDSFSNLSSPLPHMSAKLHNDPGEKLAGRKSLEQRPSPIGPEALKICDLERKRGKSKRAEFERAKNVHGCNKDEMPVISFVFPIRRLSSFFFGGGYVSSLGCHVSFAWGGSYPWIDGTAT